LVRYLLNADLIKSIRGFFESLRFIQPPEKI
jgi:hypothetical protein